LLVDADACPVKEEVYRVALRHDLKVYLVSQGPLRVPPRGRVEHVRVAPSLDAADDWIAERAGERDVVVTSDIPLAARCLAGGAIVLTPQGKEFTEDSIGEAIAGRELMDQLRQMGIATGGPATLTPSDRSRFAARLSAVVDEIRNRRPAPGNA
jgi:uncharacterized protein YaiI (UPF0178 family)